jgi:hypothetical protein
LVNVDESTISHQSKNHYSWLLRGRSSQISNIKFKNSMHLISSIASDGRSHTAIVKGKTNADIFVAYLKALLAFLTPKLSNNSKIVLMLDN